MTDNLTMINNIIEVHNTIRDNVKLVGDSLTDLEALLSLQKTDAGWSLGPKEAIADNKEKLIQTLNALEEGLKNHFKFEEKALPPLLDRTVMLELTHDHKEIGKLISEAKSLVADTIPEGLSQEQLLNKKSKIQQSVTNILWKVEEHAHREETTLKTVQKALKNQKT